MSSSSRRRVCTRASISGSKKRKTRLCRQPWLGKPECRRSSATGRDRRRRPGASAAPMLAPTVTVWPSRSKGWPDSSQQPRQEIAYLARAFRRRSEEWRTRRHQAGRRCLCSQSSRRSRAASALQQHVAQRMGERVVDPLEVVEIDAQHRKARAAVHAGDHLLPCAAAAERDSAAKSAVVVAISGTCASARLRAVMSPHQADSR